MLGAAGNDPARQTIAISYWMAVRLFGSACFHYGKERDEVDLEAAMRGEEIPYEPPQWTTDVDWRKTVGGP